MPSSERSLAVETHVPLAPHSTLGVGGPARWFARAREIEDVASAVRWCGEQQVTLFVLGGGSNLVVADEGVDGLVLQIAMEGVAFTSRQADTLVRAAAGEPWDRVVSAAVARGLAGLECLSGIPGSVGGTPVQNVGAYGQDVSGSLEHVVAFDRHTGSVVTLSNAECGFAYRQSRFKRDEPDRYVVCEVAFALRPGPPTVTYPDLLRYFERRATGTPTVADARAAVLEIRRAKGMVLDPADADTRSVGSFFMNPIVTADRHREVAATSADGEAPRFRLTDGRVKIPAAWLIERAGFAKGYDAGRVGLSTKHPLAIVNRGGATARDIVRLAVRIKRQVLDRFGVALHPEPVFVGFGDDPDVAYLHASA